MTREKQQHRRHAADHAFSVGVSLKLLGLGLKCSISPDAIDDHVQARLNSVYSTIERVASELTQIARDIWGQQEGGEGDGLRDTKIGL